MITFLHGTIVEKHPTRVVLNVGGVGYEVLIPLSSYDRLPAGEEHCRILTYEYVREDTHRLYGFMTEAERAMFVLLLGINGIGPKLALSALSGLTVRELKAAVARGDVARLSSISGIGKRTAERMAVELRSRMEEGAELEAAGAAEASPGETALRDAVLALIALGYRQSEARQMAARAIRKTGAETDVENIIKAALAG